VLLSVSRNAIDMSGVKFNGRTASNTFTIIFYLTGRIISSLCHTFRLLVLGFRNSESMFILLNLLAVFVGYYLSMLVGLLYRFCWRY
jgi:hypothetical protein